MPALWESDHPYYCTEGCYYSNECHIEVPSWAAFRADTHDYFELARAHREAGKPEPKTGDDGWYGGWHNTDPDLNLLYRWDWEDGKGEDENGVKEGEAELRLYFMLQRKARPMSVYIKVTHADEPEVRAWLFDRWRHLMRLWHPLAPDIEPGAPAEAVIERACLFYGESAP